MFRSSKTIIAFVLAMILCLSLASLAAAATDPDANPNPEEYGIATPAPVAPKATPLPAATKAPGQQVPSAAPGQQAPIVLPTTAPGTGKTTVAGPDNFDYGKATGMDVLKYYTRIRLPGFDHPLYAFTDKDGKTQYRVYGRLPGGKRGFYAASVSGEAADTAAGWSFIVEIVGEKPIKDSKVFAIYKGKDPAKEEVPAGFKNIAGKGVYRLFNIFGKSESVCYASLDGQTYGWYPARSGKPVAGALEYDLDGITQRLHIKGEKYYFLPAKLENGFAKPVKILTTDGKTAVVLTDRPELVRDELKQR